MVVVMENHSAADISGNGEAPYINTHPLIGRLGEHGARLSLLVGPPCVIGAPVAEVPPARNPGLLLRFLCVKHECPLRLTKLIYVPEGRGTEVEEDTHPMTHGSTAFPEPSASQRKRNGFAVTALVLGVVGLVIGFLPLLSPVALLLAVVGVVFGVLACVNARRGLSSKPISISGLVLSILAVGLSVWGIVILTHATQQLASDLSSIGAPSPATASVVTSPSNSTEPPTAVTSSPTSTPAGPAAPGGPSSAPAPSTQAAQYAPTGTYDVAANTGSTLTFQTHNAKGQISLSNWVRSAKSASSFSTPAPGKRWVAFKVNIQNTGTTPLSFNGMGFILIDKEGYRYQSGGAMADVTAGQRLSSGELAPGEKTTGYVVTEVPSNASILELKMDPTYGDGSWALK